MPEPITIYFFGTGGSTPFSGRKFPCIGLKYKMSLVLFDVGECCQFSLMNSKIRPLRHEIIILITHFHADHTSGLPGLLHTFSLMEMQNPVKIIGPEGLHYIIKHLFQAFLIPKPTYPLEIIEVDTDESNVVVNHGDFSIISFPTLHSIPSLGYIFQEKDIVKFDAEKADELGIPRNWLRKKLLDGESIVLNGRVIRPSDVIKEVVKGRKVVYTGDTSLSEDIIYFSRNADLLIHEATYLDPKLARERMHSALEDAIYIAEKAKVKKLALVHISSRHEIEEYVDRISRMSVSDFDIIIPQDGDSLVL